MMVFLQSKISTHLSYHSSIGSSVTAPVLARFAGPQATIPYIYSSGIPMLITFSSNRDYAGRGFAANYFTSPHCHGTLEMTETNGTITNPPLYFSSFFFFRLILLNQQKIIGTALQGTKQMLDVHGSLMLAIRLPLMQGFNSLSLHLIQSKVLTFCVCIFKYVDGNMIMIS